jgi:hypothetical protein
MLRPQDIQYPGAQSLNGLWQFALDPSGQGRTDRWFAEDTPAGKRPRYWHDF